MLRLVVDALKLEGFFRASAQVAVVSSCELGVCEIQLIAFGAQVEPLTAQFRGLNCVRGEYARSAVLGVLAARFVQKLY